MKNKSIFSLSLLAAFLLASGPLAWSTTCTTTSDTGQCPSSGAYASSTSLSESNGYNTYVDNNISDGYGVSPAAQTLTVTTPESWSVSADFGSTTHQMSNPYIVQDYNNEAVSSFTNIVGTFNTTVPTATTTASQVGFYIYLNDDGNLIYIENYNVETSQCGGTTPVKTDIAFGGSYGVSTEDWNLCDNGEYYWQYDGSGASYGFTSGSAELISMIKYMETNGYLPSSSTISSIAYGFFIDTTDGAAQTFALNSYTLINNASGGTTVATPTFSPGAGTYTTAQSVSISDGTSGATIYYTTNDTTPTTSSSVYSSAIDVSATETLEALATHSGDTNSSVGTAAYTISSEATVATPTFSPAAGTYTTAQSVSISDGTSGATIYYTTNDTTPTTSSSVYSSAIDVSATETLEALATHSGDTNSAVGTAAYTINSGSSPTISLNGSSLIYEATASGSNPAAIDVTATNSGGGTLASPTTSINYNSGSGWLTAPVSGSSGGPYTIAVQPATGSLAAGTYTATVNVASSGATNTPQSFTVTFITSSSAVCEATGTEGSCPVDNQYYDTSLTPTTWGQVTQNDTWSAPSGLYFQDLYSTSPVSWYAELLFPTDSTGAIHTYPSSAIQWLNDGDYDDPNPTLDSFTEMVTSFSQTVPASSTGTVTDVGFDNWMNDWADEIMVQTQMVNIDVCTDWTTVIVTDVEFGGSDGVPDAYWSLCQNGTFSSTSTPELIWQYYAAAGSKNFGESSSSIDLYHMLKYLEGNDICKTSTGTTDCLPTGSTFTQTTYGMEVNGTAGEIQEFELNSWTMTEVQ